jgi:predicted CDP-diglyceride synthetase/phosphatidate cytidylyltransferase
MDFTWGYCTIVVAHRAMHAEYHRFGLSCPVVAYMLLLTLVLRGSLRGTLYHRRGIILAYNLVTAYCLSFYADLLHSTTPWQGTFQTDPGPRYRR